jgi:hypothetical protein
VRARRSGLPAEGKEEKERAALLVVLEEGCVRWKKDVAVLVLVLLVLKLLVQARGRKKLAAEKAALGEEIVARCRKVAEEASMMLPFSRVVWHSNPRHQAAHFRVDCLWRVSGWGS